MKKVKVAHKGRICRYPCCKNVLSIYNHGCYCYVHRDKLILGDKLKVSRF